MSAEIRHCCVCGKPVDTAKINATHAALLISFRVVADVTPVCIHCMKKQKYK